jgi:hypothetical protein
MNTEYVYILSNESMPGLVKVGLTTVCPKGRAADLSGSTSCPTPFVVERYFEVDDCVNVETTAHAVMDEYRVNAGREFFRCSVAQASKSVGKALDMVLEGHVSKPARRRKDTGSLHLPRVMTKASIIRPGTPAQLQINIDARADRLENTRVKEMNEYMLLLERRAPRDKRASRRVRLTAGLLGAQ